MPAWLGAAIPFLAGLFPFAACLAIARVRKNLPAMQVARLLMVFCLGFFPHVVLSAVLYHGWANLLFYYISWFILFLVRRVNRTISALVAVLCGIGLGFPVSSLFRVEIDAAYSELLDLVLYDMYGILVRTVYFVTVMLLASYLMKPTREPR